MLLKGTREVESFYPFVENGESPEEHPEGELSVRHPARIAVFDDVSAAPRVVVIEPTDVRSYLEEITKTVTQLAQEQGSGIPFTVIREIVENLIHAYFQEPTVSILDHGDTIRFSDQGPGIGDKRRALEYGTTSASNEMKRYIRGVGSGLPYAQQWLEEKGGSLTVEDNIHKGTVVTISLANKQQTNAEVAQPMEQWQQSGAMQQMSQQMQQGSWPQRGDPQQMQQMSQQGYPQQAQQGAWPQQTNQQMWPQNSPMQQNPYPTQAVPYPQQGFQQPMQQDYPQFNPMQGYPQQSFQPAYPQQMAQSFQAPYPQLSERGRLIMDHLRGNESVGPRDLVELHGMSESTWSRELSQLEDCGLVSKRGGQKRHLTQLGRQYLGLT